MGGGGGVAGDTKEIIHFYVYVRNRVNEWQYRSSYHRLPLPDDDDTLRETISWVLMSDPRTQLVVNPSITNRSKNQDFIMHQAVSLGYVDRKTISQTFTGKSCRQAKKACQRKIWIGSCDVTKTERAHEVVRGEILDLQLQGRYST